MVGHGEWLPWQEQSARRGTVWHGEPELRFHASPTYVLHERLDNFIAGHRLIQDALDRKWKKAETHRLGHENSEDALTWNVFRSLQEADALDLALRVLGGSIPTGPLELYLWGRHISLDETSEWEGLSAARDAIEPGGGQQTEPDCCIRVPGQALILIEAKFGSPTATKRDDKARNDWLDRYAESCPGVFDREAILNTPPVSFPEQLLRNVALGLRMCQPGERVIVVALMRDSDQTPAHMISRQCLSQHIEVEIKRSTWESIYAALPHSRRLSALRTYLERKSYRLQRAFDLNGASR
jgi:hypothetical protein